MPDASLPPPKRRRIRPWIIAAVAGGVAFAGWKFALRDRIPDPPAIQAQDGADVQVTELLERLRADVSAAPRSGEKWGELGMAFAAHGYESEANLCFAQAERFEPDQARWPYLQGVYTATRDREAAPAHLERALRLAPRDAAALGAVRMRLAEAWMDLNRNDSAQELVRLQLSADSSDPRARFLKARLAMLAGDNAAAATELMSLTENPFVRKRAHIQLASLARERGDGRDAEAHATTAQSLRDDLPWTDPYLRDLLRRTTGQQSRLREAERLEAEGNLTRAAELMVEVAQSDPSPRVLAAAAMYLMKLREHAQAEELLRQCLRLQPGHSQAEYFLCVALFERGDAIRDKRPAEAKQLFREAAEHGAAAVESKPDHGLAWLYCGRSLLAAGDAEAAVRRLRQAAVVRPEFMDTHLYLAEALLATNQKTEAVREARNAEELAGPDDPRPRQLLERLDERPRRVKP